MYKPTEGPWIIAPPDCDPYEDIRIMSAERGRGHVICRLGLDDAPVHDFNGMQRANARLIVLAPAMAKLTPRLVAVINDFLPNVGRCVLQNYGELNSSLVDARRVLTELEKLK